jgi:GMP synthase (glutamine-hydrolysing)
MKPTLIVQNHEIENAGTIIDYLSERQMPFEIVHTWRGDSIPESESNLATVVMGCPLSVKEIPNHEFLKHLYAFVSRTVRNNHPYLGICFGGQILARVMGAKVEPNPEKEIGTFTHRLTAEGQSDPLFRGFPSEFPAFHWHSDTFRIPFGASNLAESDKCKNQAFRVGKAVGLQFHFEADRSKLPNWCEYYAPELTELGLTANAVTSEFEAHADDIRRHNYLLLDNFFALV